jgi:hypothetical protein
MIRYTSANNFNISNPVSIVLFIEKFPRKQVFSRKYKYDAYLIVQLFIQVIY